LDFIKYAKGILHPAHAWNPRRKNSDPTQSILEPKFSTGKKLKFRPSIGRFYDTSPKNPTRSENYTSKIEYNPTQPNHVSGWVQAGKSIGSGSG
jgi:hypothetical protein